MPYTIPGSEDRDVQAVSGCAAGPAFLASKQCGDHGRRGCKSHAFTLRTGRKAECCGKMRFAGAGVADHEHILLFSDIDMGLACLWVGV